MAQRRRGGKRDLRRKKVSREEMARFVVRSVNLAEERKQARRWWVRLIRFLYRKVAEAKGL